ncbi:DUF6252 family protein [Flavobacterium polysaccharolyticum]|uniref:DUF6252 family protein n=1 Tax=Flavobacterium polysaccharolyticum TaxID=3133148 RepID=A0ABU9NTM4_9FLAO
MRKYIGMGLVIMTLFFVGCSNDETSEDNTSGTITATINGTPWKGSKIINVSLIQVTSSGEQRFDISAQDGKQMLSLAFSSQITAKGMPVRTYSFDNDDALFLNTYLIGNSTFTEHSPVSGQLTITAIDTDKKTISGTFSFQNEKIGILQTEIVTPEMVNVTEGVFTNLTYKVITDK